MHMKADVLNDMSDAWTSKPQVLEGTGETEVVSSVGDRISGSANSLELVLMGVAHGLKDCILARWMIFVAYCFYEIKRLLEVQRTATPRKKMKIAEICHGKLLL